MKIEDLGIADDDGRVRASATVRWEDSDRPDQRVFFEMEEQYAPFLGCNPHAFIVATVLPAMRHGEKRIAMREPICPELRDGLHAVARWLCAWYGPQHSLPAIEAGDGIPMPPSGDRADAAMFLSGGLDSLAILRANRLNFPLSHRRAVRVGLLVHGFDIGSFAQGDAGLAKFDQALTTLGPIAEDAEILLVPLYTNVRHLADDISFWMHEFHGAALSAVAHACAPRLDSVAISSTATIEELHPWGSHPLIDPNYSSSDLTIRHEGLHLSRLDKARLIGDWGTALQGIRVCWENPAGSLNCGVCEKCVRTMTEFLAIGKLEQTEAFPFHDIRPEQIVDLPIGAPYIDAQWLELVTPLQRLGRLDLVNAIQMRSARYRKHLAWEEERDWKGSVKRFDRKWLGSALYKTYSRIRNGPAHTAPVE